MMATDAHSTPVRSVSIGRVYGRAFRAIGANPLVMFGIAFLFAALPNMATVALGSARDRVSIDGGSALLALSSLSVLSYLASIIFSVLAQGALVRATVAASEGRRASFGESLGAALPIAFPLIGLGIVVSVGVMLGLLFLIVPGVMLYIFWIVSAPVMVEERTGVFAALRRSRELTSGARWTIFALLLTAGIIYGLIVIVGGLAVVAAGMADADGTSPFGWGAILGGTLLSTITTALWSVIVSSLYVELRGWKDGPDEDALLEVFA